MWKDPVDRFHERLTPDDIELLAVYRISVEGDYEGNERQPGHEPRDARSGARPIDRLP